MSASALSLRSRLLTALIAASLLAGILTLIAETSAEATPVATNDATYQLCGRAFSDPQAYWPAPSQDSGKSPWAKGNAVCQANDFITYQEMKDGMTYLEGLFPDFLEFYELEKDFGGDDECATSTDTDDMCSAGLPQIGGARRREDLFMIRVTDERVADAGKRFFVFPLSIHGIERAGAEAGTRAAEDLATWAFCESVAAGTLPANPVVNCAKEGRGGTGPYPLLETQPTASVTAGDALRRSAIYFVFANADGWRRGDPDNIARFYQRYNGNGVDMNRDWPTKGFTFRPYTPWSEPETRSFGEVLKGIRPKWDGGIDLHGQLIDTAFSFTLLGASQRNYAKNQRILQTVKGAWQDAEARLQWSPLIKPNNAPQDDPRLYGVQWGTVWDTIDYTVTGSLGDWIDSPLGLDADGIDNEMSLSHISNCGTGTCYQKDAEQLHVDGNKSLVYAMVNYTLQPEDDRFRVPGKVGYVLDPTRVSDPGSPTPTPPGLPTQAPIMDVHLDPSNDFTYEFEIEGPESDPPVYNGGVTGTGTPAGNLSGVGGTSLSSLVLERYRPNEENPPPTDDAGCGGGEDNWEEVNRYFNQSSIYLQAGQAVHGNYPSPGPWRICLTGGLTTQLAASGGFMDLDITFQAEQAWEDPGQLPYNVSNMDFFEELKPYMVEAGQLQSVTVEQILAGTVDLNQFRSLVIADDAFPGYTEPAPTGPAQSNQTHNNPGLGTAPCAYQRGTTDVPPGSNNPQPGCANSFEFDVDGSFNNQKMTVELTTNNPEVNDWDLYVDRQGSGGGWSEVARSAGGTGNEKATVFTPPPGHYRALVVNWSASDPSSAQTLDITFSNVYEGPPIEPSTRSEADRELWAQRLRAFVQSGGNLVLTDGALKDLAYMGLIPRNKISSFSAYAGFIGFTRDGGSTSTYNDPLAKDVNQPGAAEGPGHRHQTYEPVPIGYAIQDEGGSDFNSSPVWAVEQQAWESAGGRTVGTTTSDRATLGEIKVGQGQVRIIGALLPMPSEQYYHPFGLSSYALTYSGYQVLNNALQVGPRPAVPGGPGGGKLPAKCAKAIDAGLNGVLGTPGKDKLRGTSEADVICALGGNDVARGLAGNDLVIGGGGNDVLVAGGGNDRVLGEKGNDRLRGGSGKDRLVGHKGNDRLSGGSGREVLKAGGGVDRCNGGPGKDSFRRCETRIG